MTLDADCHGGSGCAPQLQARRGPLPLNCNSAYRYEFRKCRCGGSFPLRHLADLEDDSTRSRRLSLAKDQNRRRTNPGAARKRTVTTDRLGQHRSRRACDIPPPRPGYTPIYLCPIGWPPSHERASTEVRGCKHLFRLGIGLHRVTRYRAPARDSSALCVGVQVQYGRHHGELRRRRRLQAVRKSKHSCFLSHRVFFEERLCHLLEGCSSAERLRLYSLVRLPYNEPPPAAAQAVRGWPCSSHTFHRRCTTAG